MMIPYKGQLQYKYSSDSTLSFKIFLLVLKTFFYVKNYTCQNKELIP